MYVQRVLIVDDEPMNISILEEILEDEFVLESATSGEEALGRAMEFRPDVILLDLMMPGIDGYETCRKLRENSKLRDAKIVLVSAKALVSERLEGYEAGADDYVTKPYDSEELLAKVRVFARLKSLEEVARLRSQLLALFSHETRTPLTGIIGPTDLLLDSEDVSEEERVILLESIRDNADRLRLYFDKALMLFELMSGRFPMQMGTVEINDMLSSAISSVSEFASSKGVQIAFEEPQSQISIQGDREFLERAITTVLENALRFSPSDDTIEIHTRTDDKKLELCVIDHGEGVDPDIFKDVLEGGVVGKLPHHQGGTGLSLAIASRILAHHEGSIEFESTAGGTQFRFVVPLSQTRSGVHKLPHQSTATR